MSVTFDRRYLDVAQFIAYKRFVEFDDELVTWDTGPLANNGQALSSATGAAGSWAQLFGVTGAAIGNCNVDDGNGLSVFEKHLFVSLYRTVITEPKIIEYDPVSGVVTNHLPNPQAGGANNAMGADSLVWNRHLWLVTDVTAGVANRRVVYYYDGTSWTAITDYDGATYLDFNRADANSPIQQLKHRVTRLFVFNSELYLIATRWSGTEWAWEIWKFNAENYNQFNLLYDSSALADNFCLSAIVENTVEGKVYVVGNEIQTNGNPMNIAKLYSSEDMETWTEESLFPLFEDEFDDAARDARWTDSAGNGTINEAAGLLTMAVAGGVNGDPATANAPIVIMTPGESEITIEVLLNSYTVNDDTRAGIYVTSAVAPATGLYFTRYRNDTFPRNGLQVKVRGGAQLAYVAVTTLPIYLRVRISGSGAGSVMKFDYSTDRITWTTLLTRNNETWSLAGLVTGNWGVFNAISAPFEYFRIYKSVGWPYGEEFFDGLIYLNCMDTLKTNTWVRYWDELADEFTLEQEITTNANNRGGGLESFLGDLYAGKYMEIYGAPGPTYKQTRTKARSLVGIELTSIDKLGVETVRRYAPIDTRAPTRFYSGKLKSLSSCQRSVDDITGLFRIADMSAVLDNSQMDFSTILAGTSYFKNQVMKIFHMWADEPERLRQHIISLIVEDHSIKGVDFKLKFKDISQKYFETRVPTSICSSANYPDIHPDYEGEPMPEVLGLAEWSDGADKGAVKAMYVDTTGPPFRYIASSDRERLLSIDRVWADNVERFAGGGANQYQITWGPPTTIDMNTDQGDAIVSFNGKGYSVVAWDSVNTHIQNPAYVILYFLRFILNIPFSVLDVPSFDALATIYENMGAETSGNLILQRRGDAIEALRQLLFSFGAKCFMAKGGKFQIARKDISNYASNTFLSDQNDTLAQAEMQWNLKKAMNVSNDRYGYIPWLRLFTSAAEASRDTYPETIEDDVTLPKEYLPV